MKAEEYYQSIESRWKNEYPSMKNIEDVWGFYKECGYKDPQKTLLELLGKVDWEKKRVLDFGCDTGFMLKFICDSLPKLTGFGVDINGSAIKEATENFPQLHFSSFDGFTLPFEDKYFDMVFVSAVIKHVRYEDREHVYQELKRVATHVFLVEMDSKTKEKVSHGNWTFYHSNFEEEFATQFEPVEVLHEGNDLLGLYKCR